jgi:ATP-binding cassette subfamily B protein
MIKILKYLKPKEWALAAVSFGFVIFQVFLDLQLPSYMHQITAILQTPDPNSAQILQIGGFMLACALGSLACAFVVGFFAARIGAGFSRRLREEVYSKTQAFSMQEIGKFSTASLITRSTNDISQVQIVVAMGLQILMRAPVMAIWATAEIAQRSWQWTIATAIAIAFMLTVATFLLVVVMPKFKIIQFLTDKLNAVTRENLEGVRVVRAYNAESFQAKRFKKANDELTKTYLFTTRAMAIMMPGLSLILNGLSLSVYWLGAHLINTSPENTQTLFSDMIVFSAYAMQLIMSFIMMILIFAILPRASVSAMRVNEVLQTKTSINDGDLDLTYTDLKGVVEFKKVSFRYPDAEEYILKDINFKVDKGQTVAFIGSTGSGKSTLINLVPRFFDATEGEVLVDGFNVRDYTLKSLNNKLGYVSQKAVLFSGTVSENINYGEGLTPDVGEDEVKKAASIAKAKSFVEEMPEGFESRISQGGTNLSGGQKQRISIARAICKNPEIYIFDDSFSALDYKTDKELRKALKTELAGATVLIVAQRIGTVLDADKIIVLENGLKVGEGTHKELMENCGIYKEIALSQLSAEEL